MIVNPVGAAPRASQASSPASEIKSNDHPADSSVNSPASGAPASLRTQAAGGLIALINAGTDRPGRTASWTEASAQASSVQHQAQVVQSQADAQSEQSTKETAIQHMNAIKELVDGLIAGYRAIRDAQEEVQANIVRNIHT